MRVLRFFNRQRAVVLERMLWRRLTRSLLEEGLGRPDYQLGVHFIAATEMARLNETFLGHEGSTDVITFNHQAGTPRRGVRSAQRADPAEQLYGEIFISVDDALSYARRFRVSWPCEVARYLVHGVLHLEGFDDADPAARRAMKRRENSLLKELSARFNLRKMGRK
jgi:probable rRNA maturation factor